MLNKHQQKIPKLSIIIPVYNVEKTLNRAVESVIHQSFSNIEIILVDDGSTDKSSNIAENLASDYKNIRVVHKENGGLASARNVGIEESTGEFIAFLDSDDYLLPGILEQIAPFTEDGLTDLIIFGIEKGNEQGSEIMLPNQTILNESSQVLTKMFIEKGVDFYTWNKIYHRSLFEQVRFPEGALYEDVLPSYAVATHMRQTVFLAIPGIYYYQNPFSIVHQDFHVKQYDNITQRKILLQKIRKNYPNLVSLAEAKLVDGYLSTGFKLTAGSSEVTKTYLKKARNEIRTQYFKFMSNKQVTLSKKLALNLLLFNKTSYHFLYKQILGK